MKVERSVEKIFDNFVLRTSVDSEIPKLLRNEHANFLKNSLRYLPGSYEVGKLHFNQIQCNDFYF